MGNYRKGPWDEQLDGLMDITACCGVAHEELEVADLLDHEMDRHQEMGYRFLRQIFNQPGSDEVKDWSRSALDQFAQAERLERLIERHVHTSDAKVTDSRERALELTPEADRQRRTDAARPCKDRASTACCTVPVRFQPEDGPEPAKLVCSSCGRCERV